MLTVGEILKKAREKKGLTLKVVEKEIHIRAKFLNALEENNWSFFSSKVYIDGILKVYAKFLALDSARISAFFRRDYSALEGSQFTGKDSSRYLIPQTKRFAVVSIAVLFLIFFGYFAYQLKLYFTPPSITILSPKTSTFKNTDSIQITGKTEKEASVSIFGEKVFLNREGTFEYNFPLVKGKNTLIIEVVGGNGRKSTLKKEFVEE